MLASALLAFASCDIEVVDDREDDDVVNDDDDTVGDDDTAGDDDAVDTDFDNDSVPDATDNCSRTANVNQADTDVDGDGNACDNCPGVANAAQMDTDGDGLGDACDNDASGTGFTITCSLTAGVFPETSTVRFESNFTPPWVVGTDTAGRAMTWVGSLDEARLRATACGVGRVGVPLCGYEANPSALVNGVRRFFLEGADSPPRLVQNGTCTIVGPLPVVMTIVSNNVGSFNFHVHL